MSSNHASREFIGRALNTLRRLTQLGIHFLTEMHLFPQILYFKLHLLDQGRLLRRFYSQLQRIILFGVAHFDLLSELALRFIQLLRH